MSRVSNRELGRHVANRTEVKNNNGTVYAEWKDDKRYVVYSYGEHYPMFIWIDGKGWYENDDPYSMTTAKHKGHARPTNCTTRLRTEAMKMLVEG